MSGNQLHDTVDVVRPMACTSTGMCAGPMASCSCGSPGGPAPSQPGRHCWTTLLQAARCAAVHHDELLVCAAYRCWLFRKVLLSQQEAFHFRAAGRAVLHRQCGEGVRRGGQHTRGPCQDCKGSGSRQLCR
jgi:hypothetical protein